MLKRLRVLEASESWGIGGTEQAIEVRASQLDPARFEVMAVGTTSGGPRLDRLREAGIPVSVCDGDWTALSRLMAEFKPHIVHYPRGATRSVFAHELQRASRDTSASLVVETNVFGRLPGGEQLRPPDAIAHMSLASMLRYSRLSGLEMTRLRSEGHLVVYLPVPASAYARSPSYRVDRTELRARLGIHPGELLACRVARPDLRKWSARLEAALPGMFARVPHLRFAFMAAPPEKERSLRRAHGERVLFLEPTSDQDRLVALYRASDIMVHGSGIGESFGLSVAEGMFFGLPVAVDSTPSMDNAQVEVVDHGTTGFVVHSPGGYVEAVSRLSDEACRSEMGAPGVHKARARFADSSVVSQWERVYWDLGVRAGLCKPWDRGTIPAVPDTGEYARFEEEYERRCAEFLGAEPTVLDRLRGGAIRALDTLGYVRRVGWGTAVRVARSRIQSGVPWRRN